MPNLIRHANDPDLYYNIDEVIELKIDHIAYTLTLLRLNGQLAIETLSDETALMDRLNDLLDLAVTSSSQYPS